MGRVEAHWRGDRLGLGCLDRQSATVASVVVIFFAVGNLLFNLHIAELVGVEDLAAFHAFNVLRIFRARDDSDSWVLAGTSHGGFLTVFGVKAFAPDCIEPWPIVQ